MEASGDSSLSWAKVESSLYAQCFTGQACTAENWCALCQGLDHTAPEVPIQVAEKAVVSGIWPALRGEG